MDVRDATPGYAEAWVGVEHAAVPYLVVSAPPEVPAGTTVVNLREVRPVRVWECHRPTTPPASAM